MDDVLRNKLILVLNAALGNAVKETTLTETDVQALKMIGKRQAILYIVITGIKNLCFGNLLSPETEDQIARASYDYVQRRESLNQISNVFDNANIPYVPLKGAILKDLYPQPSMRSSSDIDVLVREQDLDEAIKALENNTSFRYYEKRHHDAHLKNERLHLELHFSLLTNISNLDLILQQAWENTTKPDVGSCFAFTPEYQIFYITAHAAKHFIKEGGVGIRPLLDLWLLRTRTVYDEEQVRVLCENGGILGYYEMCSKLLDVWFNSKEHTDSTKEFEELVLGGGVFGSERIKALSRRRESTGAKYYFRRVFLPSKTIREDYPRSDKHPVLVPVYQVVRWTHLLNPSKRKAARAEIRQARTMDPAEVEKYDRLLKQMGL